MSQLKEQTNQFWKAVLKDPWPYWLGAIILGFLNVALFAATGTPWGVTAPFTLWGSWVWQLFGGHPENLSYFAGTAANLKSLQGGFFKDPVSIQNVGIILGALLAVLLASQFRLKKIKSWKQAGFAALGGILMGYGARIAFGCNIGAFFSGTASMSLHGWIYVVFILVGAWIGSQLLKRFLV